jgi:L1 cell adhesion molecule like protein
MVNEAEKFKAEDDAQKEILAAKNGLEAYIFQVKLSLDEQAIKNKLSKPDKNMLNREMDDALTWLDRNQAANTEEYKDKQKELEGIVNPIMSWLHRG